MRAGRKDAPHCDTGDDKCKEHLWHGCGKRGQPTKKCGQRSRLWLVMRNMAVTSSRLRRFTNFKFNFISGISPKTHRISYDSKIYDIRLCAGSKPPRGAACYWGKCRVSDAQQLMTLNLLGADELNKTLKQLPKELSQKVYMQSLRKGAVLMRDAAKERAPYGSDFEKALLCLGKRKVWATTHFVKLRDEIRITVTTKQIYLLPWRARGRGILGYVSRVWHQPSGGTPVAQASV